MAINAAFRQKAGASDIVFKAAGGSAAITLASLANTTSDLTGAQQSVKADFQVLGSGSDSAAQLYEVTAIFDWLTTAPTSGNTIEIYFNPSNSATAGNDNQGACVGTDSAYTGSTNDISVSTRRLIYIGSFVVSALAGTDIKGFVGIIQIPTRYGSIVVWNKSGRLLHSTEGNKEVRFRPIDYTGDTA
jgi:hypothetical protein